MTKALRVSLLLILALFGSGCATTDVYRPFVVDTVPVADDEVARLNDLFGESSGLQKSLRIASSQRNYFDITDYRNVFSSVDLNRLTRSLAEDGRNPWAWLLLGSHLAMNRDQERALVATDIALAEIGEVEGAENEPLLIEPRLVGHLNRALFKYGLGDYYAAYRSGMRASGIFAAHPQFAKPHFELATNWVLAMSLAELNAASRAQSYLEKARAIDDSELEDNTTIEIESGNPTLFDEDKRDSVEYMIEAIIHERSGDSVTAGKKYDRAIQNDHRNWDAHYRWAVMNSRVGQVEQARNQLSNVINEKVSGRVLRPELFNFALGNLELNEGRCRDAIGHFVETERVIEERAKTFNKRLKRPLSTVSSSNRMDETTRKRLQDLFAPADAHLGGIWNNLGRAHLECARQSGDQEDLVAAERYLTQAAADSHKEDAERARLNLAELYLVAQQPEQAVQSLTGLLKVDAVSDEAVEGLLQVLRIPELSEENATVALDGIALAKESDGDLFRKRGYGQAVANLACGSRKIASLQTYKNSCG